MKINEIVTEGFMGAVAKGIGKGVVDAAAPGAVDAAAPGAVDKIKGAKYAYDNRVRTSSADANSSEYKAALAARNLHTKMLSDRGLREKLQAAANKLKQQARANGNTIDPEDVKQGMHDVGIAEAIQESPESDAKYHYLVSLLQDAGITVRGYIAPEYYSATATDASNASITKMQGANDAAMTAKTTLTAQQAADKRARFIAVIKQQADRQGSISMTDIGKQIPKQGEYANPTRRREAIKNVAQELQQQGVTVTSGTAIPQSTTAPLPTIGGIGPSDPRYAALAAKTKNALATPVR